MALLSKMGESVKYVTGGYKLRSRPLEFAAIGDYLDTFSLKLGTIDRIAQRIIKEQLGKDARCSMIILQPERSVSVMLTARSRQFVLMILACNKSQTGQNLMPVPYFKNAQNLIQYQILAQLSKYSFLKLNSLCQPTVLLE